jgi:hypothetical protein
VNTVFDPSYAWRKGRLQTERGGAHVANIALGDGTERQAISVGGTEPFTLPRLYPNLLDVEVFLGMPGSVGKFMPIISGAITGISKVSPLRNALKKVANDRVKGSTGGPSDAERAGAGSTVTARAFAPDGSQLAEVIFSGVNGYTFTFEILAWGAIIAQAGGITATGALGPVDAFGLDALCSGVETSGLTRQ